MNNNIFKILLVNPQERTLDQRETVARFVQGSQPNEFRLYCLYENFFNKQDKTKIYN